ncbi:MAG: hypothetical protein ABIO70_31575 [Pseudomonadota bacterium]
MSTPPPTMICPQCGASPELPPKVLSFACSYCGAELVPPDLAARREALEREEAHRRKLEEREQQARLREEREAAERKRQAEREAKRAREAAARERKVRWHRRLASIPGCLFSVLGMGIALAVSGSVFYKNGTFDAWIGDAGGTTHARALRALVASGYTAGAQPEVLSTTGDHAETLVQLRADLCYGIVAASGKALDGMSLEDPSGKVVAHSDGLAYQHGLALCPAASGLYRLRVDIDGFNGRVTWGWAWKQAPRAVPRAPAGGRRK